MPDSNLIPSTPNASPVKEKLTKQSQKSLFLVEPHPAISFPPYPYQTHSKAQDCLLHNNMLMLLPSLEYLNFIFAFDWKLIQRCDTMMPRICNRLADSYPWKGKYAPAVSLRLFVRRLYWHSLEYSSHVPGKLIWWPTKLFCLRPPTLTYACTGLTFIAFLWWHLISRKVFRRISRLASKYGVFVKTN